MARKTSSQQPASFVRAIRSSSTKHIQAMAFFCFLWGFNTCMQRQQRRLRFAHKMPIEHIATTLALDFSRLLLEDYYGSSSLQNDEASTLRIHIFCVHVRERANDLSRTVPFLATLPNIYYMNHWTVFLFFLGLLFFGFMCPALWLFGWHGMTWLGMASLEGSDTYMQSRTEDTHCVPPYSKWIQMWISKTNFFRFVTLTRVYSNARLKTDSSTHSRTQISLGIFPLK